MMFRTLAIALGAGLAFAAADVSAETATIKIGSFAPPKSFAVREGTKPWMAAVLRDAGGTLKFQEFWGGALSRSPRKQYELMMNGIQDASPILPSYTQKLFPDFTVFSLPYLFRSSEEASVAAWRLYESGNLAGLEKVYVAGVYTNDNGGMHFAVKIKSVAEIKGKKMRAAGPGEAAVIKAMGGIPVGMSITQVAESLNRGVIQGTLNGWSALGSFRITPLIKSHVDQPFGVRSFFLGINKKVYDKLPAKAKQAIQKNSGLAYSRRFGQLNGGRGVTFRRKAKEDPKRNVLTPTPAEYKAQAAKFQAFHERWKAASPDRAKKYKALQAILADIRKSS